MAQEIIAMLAGCKIISEDSMRDAYFVNYSCLERNAKAEGCSTGNLRLLAGDFGYGLELLVSEVRRFGEGCPAFAPPPPSPHVPAGSGI